MNLEQATTHVLILSVIQKGAVQTHWSFVHIYRQPWPWEQGLGGGSRKGAPLPKTFHSKKEPKPSKYSQVRVLLLLYKKPCALLSNQVFRPYLQTSLAMGTGPRWRLTKKRAAAEYIQKRSQSHLQRLLLLLYKKPCALLSLWLKSLKFVQKLSQSFFVH